MHDERPGHADVTEGSGGVWERLAYDWTDPNHVVARTTDSNIWGGRSGHTYTFTRNADGTTDIDYVVVREGKNFKGHFLGVVLGSVGKSKLVKAFTTASRPSRRGTTRHDVAAMRLVRNLGAGALAGAVGTAAMDLLLYARTGATAARTASGAGSSPATS